jgi:hypothetical protein
MGFPGATTIFLKSREKSERRKQVKPFAFRLIACFISATMFLYDLSPQLRACPL